MSSNVAKKQVVSTKKGTINETWLSRKGYILHKDYQPQIAIHTRDGVVTIESAIVYKKPSAAGNNRIDVIIYSLGKEGFFVAGTYDGLEEDQVHVPVVV